MRYWRLFFVSFLLTFLSPAAIARWSARCRRRKRKLRQSSLCQPCRRSSLNLYSWHNPRRRRPLPPPVAAPPPKKHAAKVRHRRMTTEDRDGSERPKRASRRHYDAAVLLPQSSASSPPTMRP